jgi:putative RNA 2'-phosphotransferase
MNNRVVKVSKYLSKHLRHNPERIGLVLEVGGWVEVEKLLAACNQNGFTISREELDFVVANNDKKRFSFDSTGKLIRANQGHSVEVDLQLEPKLPPSILYHGTGRQFIDSILETGLLKMSRHHVHLSQNIETATNVGARHGKPVVLIVDAAKMHEDGYVFYCSDNGVWLVDNVPPQYLKVKG